MINEVVVQKVKSSIKLQSNKNNCGRSLLHEVNRATGLRYPTVRKVAKDHLHLKPYQPHFVQQLHEDDPQHRLDFEQMFKEKLVSQIDNILWSDEAHFHLIVELSSTSGNSSHSNRNNQILAEQFWR